MLVLFASLALLQTEPKVTLDAPFQTLDAVVRTVAERTGRRLAVVPSLARDMVRVRVKEVPLSVFLPRLAECAHAEWAQEGDRLRLLRGPGLERVLDEQRHAYFAKGLRHSLAKWIAEDFSTPYDPKRGAQALRSQIEDWAARAAKDPLQMGIPFRERSKRHALYEALPATQAVVRLAQKLDLDRIAAMPDRSGFVLSTAPRGDQRPFPPAMQMEIEKFRRDLSIYSEALDGWPGQDTVVPSDTASRVNFHVAVNHRTASYLDAEIRFRAFDAQDREVASGSLTLSSADLETPDPQPGEKDARLALSPRSQALAASYAFSDDEEREAPLSAEICEILRHSDRYPYFAFAWSEILPALAKDPAVNVVANLIDEVEHASWPGGTVDLRQARKLLLDRHETIREPGWFVVRPRYPGPAGAFRFDRVSTASHIRAIIDALPIPLEELAANPPTEGATTLIGRHPLTKRASFFGSAAKMALQSNPNALHFLHAINPTLRNRLLQTGGEIGWTEFGPDLQREVAATLLEAGSSTPTQTTGQNPRPGLVGDDSAAPSTTSAEEGNRQRVLDDLLRGRERSKGKATGDVLSKAKLREIRLQVVVQNEPGLFGENTDPEDPERVQLLAGSGIGTDIIPSLNSEEDSYEVDENGTVIPPPVRRFRPAAHRQVWVRLLLPGGFVVDHRAEDWTYDPQAPLVPPAKVPEALLRAIREARNRQGLHR